MLIMIQDGKIESFRERVDDQEFDFTPVRVVPSIVLVFEVNLKQTLTC